MTAPPKRRQALDASADNGCNPRQGVANPVGDDIVPNTKTIATQDDLLKMFIKPKKKN